MIEAKQLSIAMQDTIGSRHYYVSTTDCCKTEMARIRVGYIAQKTETDSMGVKMIT